MPEEPENKWRRRDMPRIVTADATAVDGDYILANATSAAIEITLPDATLSSRVIVKKTDNSGNAVAVVAPSTITINGGTAGCIITTQYNGVSIFSDGSNWFADALTKCTAPCFLAGTKVLLASGLPKSIEDIQVGDLLCSYDETKEELTASKVTEVFTHEETEYLTINNLRLTANHPLYSNNEWKEAGKIRPGDVLLDKDLNQFPVTAIESIHKRVTVYNLEVDLHHNYFADNVLVHNK